MLFESGSILTRLSFVHRNVILYAATVLKNLPKTLTSHNDNQCVRFIKLKVLKCVAVVSDGTTSINKQVWRYFAKQFFFLFFFKLPLLVRMWIPSFFCQRQKVWHIRSFFLVAFYFLDTLYERYVNILSSTAKVNWISIQLGNLEKKLLATKVSYWFWLARARFL